MRWRSGVVAAVIRQPSEDVRDRRRQPVGAPRVFGLGFCVTHPAANRQHVRATKTSQRIGRIELERAVERAFGFSQIAIEMQRHPSKRRVRRRQPRVELQRPLQRLVRARVRRVTDCRVRKEDRVARIGQTRIGRRVIGLLGDGQLEFLDRARQLARRIARALIPIEPPPEVVLVRLGPHRPGIRDGLRRWQELHRQ